MKKPSAATVIATIALFAALGGTGYAAVALAPNSVGTAQLKEGAVQSSDIKDGAIGSGDIGNGAIAISDLSTGAMKGLDGKDGKQGPAGPAGPAGSAGAVGPAGATGPAGKDATAGIKLVDANGLEITGVQSSLNPATVVNGSGEVIKTEQAGIVRLVGGVLWVMHSDGTYDPPGYKLGPDNKNFYLSADCTGPMYYHDTPGIGTPSLMTLTAKSDPDHNGPFLHYRSTGETRTILAGEVWSSYESFARSPSNNCDGGAHAPGPGAVLNKYTVTTDIPTVPTASTPPFTWVATN
jgi:hypothetical protein